MSQPSPDSVRTFAKNCVAAQSRLYCIAYGVTGNREDAEDVVQRAIMIAIQKNQPFDNEIDFLAWLAGIVRNCARNQRRKSYRRRTFSAADGTLDDLEGEPESRSPVDSGTGQIRDSQQAFDDRVAAALHTLGPSERSCLLLRTIEGLSYREIATLLSVSEGAAMNMVYRSRKRMRQLLADENIDPAVGENS